MAPLRISRAAQADLVTILAVSVERWGESGRERYAALLAAAMRKIAADPHGSAAKERPELGLRVCSYHIRHARRGHGVGAPVHVLYYRIADEGSIELIRVLHERMEPRRHLDAAKRPSRARPGRRR